jgi:putative peptide zinc metalloprotease protein
MTDTIDPPKPQRRRREARSSHEAPPRLAEGTELIGEYEGSGFKETPYIARRADGQVIQLTYLLHLVAGAVDGRRGYKEIAGEVTEAFGRCVSAGNVQFLVEKQLRPLGVLAAGDGSSPEVKKPDPLLALKFRVALVPERAVQPVTTLFKPLFLPPVMVAVLCAIVALDVWVFFIHGIGQGVRESVYQPLLLVVFFGLIVVATAFHEIGHATACRYGGAKPGVLGAGIYIVWPVFYCDVTDAYRLGKRGRLRTDLGGVYFNVIFALLMAGVYFVTSFEPILLVILLQHFAILQQLMPLLRLDGYYIMSDLTGVPDILSRVRPILRSLIPGRGPDEKVRELKPWVRVVVSAYVLTLIPVLLLAVVMMLLSAPRVFATAYDSVGVQYDNVAEALDQSKGINVAAGALQIVAICLPCLGMVFTSGRISSRVGKGAWSWSEDSPARRAGLSLVAAGLLGFAAFTWWPNGEYRPIQSGEQWTIQGGLSSLSKIPSGRPSLTPDRQEELGGAPTVREQGGDFRSVPGPGTEGSSSEREGSREGGAPDTRREGESAPAQEDEAAPEGSESSPEESEPVPGEETAPQGAPEDEVPPRRVPEEADRVRPPPTMTIPQETTP